MTIPPAVHLFIIMRRNDLEMGAAVFAVLGFGDEVRSHHSATWRPNYSGHRGEWPTDDCSVVRHSAAFSELPAFGATSPHAS